MRRSYASFIWAQRLYRRGMPPGCGNTLFPILDFPESAKNVAHFAEMMILDSDVVLNALMIQLLLRYILLGHLLRIQCVLHAFRGDSCQGHHATVTPYTEYRTLHNSSSSLASVSASTLHVIIIISSVSLAALPARHHRSHLSRFGARGLWRRLEVQLPAQAQNPLVLQ